MGSQGIPQPRGWTSAGATSCNLPRAPIAPILARRTLASGLADLPRSCIEDAQVLTSELVTNALRHGQGTITMSILRDDRTLTVGVADQGSQDPQLRERDVTAVTGRGLQLLQALAAGWGTDPVQDGTGGKVIWFTLCTASSRS
ncbi:MAG: hypothetical protein QOK15_3930 [Nocardioidaceae bacterium]|jgi:hypothetical protein|nr:hypothetical protein [Nocardioidaceae bacterium]